MVPYLGHNFGEPYLKPSYRKAPGVEPFAIVLHVRIDRCHFRPHFALEILSCVPSKWEVRTIFGIIRYCGAAPRIVQLTWSLPLTTSQRWLLLLLGRGWSLFPVRGKFREQQLLWRIPSVSDGYGQYSGSDSEYSMAIICHFDSVPRFFYILSKNIGVSIQKFLRLWVLSGGSQKASLAYKSVAR